MAPEKSLEFPSVRGIVIGDARPIFRAFLTGAGTLWGNRQVCFGFQGDI